MKSSKMLIKIIFILMAMFVIISNINIVKADDDISLKKMEDQAKNFLNTGAGQSKVKVEEITKGFKSLGQILTLVGAGVLVAVTAYMGIKYLTAGPEAQAKLKIQLIGIVVSGVVIFGAYGIWSLVVRIASQF